MRNLAALERLGTDFNRANPSRLGDPGRCDALVPHVLRDGRHREVVRLDDQVRFRLAECGRKVPALAVWPLLRRGHVFRITLWRPTVDPADDRVDLLVGERAIVLEFLNTDAAIDLPRWHLTVGHPRLDRPG